MGHTRRERSEGKANRQTHTDAHQHREPPPPRKASRRTDDKRTDAGQVAPGRGGEGNRRAEGRGRGEAEAAPHQPAVNRAPYAMLTDIGLPRRETTPPLGAKRPWTYPPPAAGRAQGPGVREANT